MSKLTVLFIFFATLQLSQAIHCWYGSDRPDESIHKLRIKHDDYCVLSLDHDEEGQAIAMFMGQLGELPKDVDLSTKGVECRTMKTDKHTAHQCFCGRNYCNNFALLQELTGDLGRW